MNSSLPSLKRDTRWEPAIDAPLRGVISGALLGLLLWIVLGIGTSYALAGGSAVHSAAVRPPAKTTTPALPLNG